MKDIELKIEDVLTDGVFALSLVNNPAIEEDFIHLSAHEETVNFSVVNEERRVIVGVALVPEKKILRKVKDKFCNVYFTAKTIAQSQELFMKNLNLSNFTKEHEAPIKGVSVVESWIVEDTDNDKSNIYNLNAPIGSWVVMSKIDNDEEWEKVKDGTYKGYSIEARYKGLEQMMERVELTEEQKIQAIIDIIK